MKRATLLSVAVAALLAGMASPAAAQDLYGVTTDNRLIRFDPEAPGTLKKDVPLGVADAEGLNEGGPLYAFARGELRLVDEVTGADEGPHNYWRPAVGDGAVTDVTNYVYTDADRMGSWPIEPASLDIVAAGAGHMQSPYDFAIDAAGDQLVRLREHPTDYTAIGGPAATAHFDAIGPLGLDVPHADVGFELSRGRGYLAMGGALYRVDLETGATTSLGPIGDGRGIRDLSFVAPPEIRFFEPRRVGVSLQSVFENGYTGGRVRFWRIGDPEVELRRTLRFASAPTLHPLYNVGATAGEDFEAVTHHVVIPPRVRSVDVTIPMIDDDEVENLETINIVGEDGEPIGWGLTIWDDDMQFQTTVLSASEAAGVATVQVEREDARYPTSVALQTSGGTATAGEDYKAAPARVSFGAGETSKVVSVPLVDDAVAEPDETVALRLSAPTVTRFVNPQRTATLTIRSDDVADRRAPGVRVLLSGLRLRRSVKVPFACTEACSARVELRVDAARARRLKVPRRVAQATVRAPQAGRRTARLRIAARTLRRLRKARRVPMTVRIVAADAAGNRRTATRRVTARR
jgi:hypothetical protein